jgi:hypothetical protein
VKPRSGIKRLGLILTVTVGVAGLAGCAGMSGTQKGAAIGAGTGAVAGAIIGNQVKGNRPGHAATGAIIGALGGAAVGAIAGDQYDKKTAQEVQSVPPPPATGAYPPPPPGTYPGTYPPPPASNGGVTVPGQYSGDPTRGQIVNTTPYRVQLYLDTDPARHPSAASYSLGPSEALPVNLDVGNHRVVAVATRDTQFGPRTVGQVDRQLRVDVRGSGWELRLTEGDFR